MTVDEPGDYGMCGMSDDEVEGFLTSQSGGWLASIISSIAGSTESDNEYERTIVFAR